MAHPLRARDERRDDPGGIKEGSRGWSACAVAVGEGGKRHPRKIATHITTPAGVEENSARGAGAAHVWIRDCWGPIWDYKTIATADIGNLSKSMRFRDINVLLAPAFLLCVHPAFATDNGPSLAAILEKSAKASGAQDRSAYDCHGACLSHGAREEFRFAFDGVNFYNAAKGPLDDIAGFDGKGCWIENWAGMPHYVGLLPKDSNELLAWVISGEWALPECPLTRTLTERHANEVEVNLQPKDGATSATLTIDTDSMLPKKLKYWTDSGDEVWEFSDYKNFGGRTLPRRSTHVMSHTTDWYEIEDAKPSKLAAKDFSLPKPDLSDTTYDASHGNEVEIKRIFGYIFVRPQINGKDVGWFFLDTGADVMCIDPKVAQEDGFAKLGTDTTAGVVAVVKLGVVRGQSFQLGPVTIKNPTFYAFDMTPFQAFGIKVSGICGYDFLARTVLDIDPKGLKMAIYEPAKAPEIQDAQWENLTFNGDTPCIQCGFEGDRHGVFSLDTGSSSTVDLFSPIVAKLGLLRGRETTSVNTGGAGGSAVSHTGTISYFEVGGHRFDKPTVGLQVTKQGVFASPYLAGNVGMGFLGHFKLVFDYQRSRIGFIEPDKG